MEDKKNNLLTEAKTTFEKLKTDKNSSLFAEAKINNKLLKKLKKSKYSSDKKLLKLISSLENLEDINKKNKQTIPITFDFVEKRDRDRSTLYSVDRPFQLIHADIADLRFLNKSVTHPKYCLLAVDVFSSKVYIYPMLTKRLKMFYEDIQPKKKQTKCICKQTWNFKNTI